MMSNAILARQIAELESKDDLSLVEARRLQLLVDGDRPYGRPRPKFDHRHRRKGEG